MKKIKKTYGVWPASGEYAIPAAPAHPRGNQETNNGHILAVLIPGMDCRKVILRARKLVAGGSKWSVIYTRDQSSWKNNLRLAQDLELARHLGANIMVFPDCRPEEACVEAVQKENADMIIVGRRKGIIRFFCDTRRLHRLGKLCQEADITVVPTSRPAKSSRQRASVEPLPMHVRKNHRLRLFTTIVLATVALCALLALLIGRNDAQYVAFGVLILLLFVIAATRMGTILFFTLLSAILFVIMLVSPYFSLHLEHSKGDLSFILSFFAIVLANGLLAIKYQNKRRQVERQARHANALFEISRRLSNADSIDEVINASKQEMLKYFSINIYFILQDGHGNMTNHEYAPKEPALDATDMEAVEYAFKHNRQAGRFTSLYSSSRYTFDPINTPTHRLGVAVTELNHLPDADAIIFRNSMFEQIARSLEFHLMQEQARGAKLLQESEKLYKTLFNSISHELRSPLAAIMGASDILLAKSHSDAMDRELCGVIMKASERLDKVIENLLNMSRLESEHIAANPIPCDVYDLLASVANNLSKELACYDFHIRIHPPVPIVNLDFGLTEQALYNLVYNSIQYAPAGTEITLEASCAHGWLELTETDCGPGFDEGTLPMVFDKFWRKKDSNPGGLGLGLSIVKGFIETQGGTVEAANRPEGGVQFTIRIPVKTENTPES